MERLQDDQRAKGVLVEIAQFKEWGAKSLQQRPEGLIS